MTNMYEGVKPINELGGRCKHECDYCSTHTLRRVYPGCKAKYEGEYRIYESELKKNYHNKTLFVCGQNDLFEESVPSELILRILKRANERSKDNIIMLQTKNPKRFHEFFSHIPFENTYLGTTIETNREDLIRKHTKAPTIDSRIKGMNQIIGFKKYVTIEPIMDFDVEIMSLAMFKIRPNKIFIGADSKNNNLPEPSKEKVLKLIEELKGYRQVELKSNLKRIVGNDIIEDHRRQEE
jgi:DNA repair photolyase